MFFKKLWSKKSNKIIISVQHGLGNRLRALASAKLLADSINRVFVLAWVKDNHCEAGFFDLFDDSGFEIIENNPDFSRDDLKIYNYMDKEFLDIQGIENKKDEFIDIPANLDILAFSAYTLNHEYKNYIEESKIIRELNVKAELQKIINSYDLSDMIGVHVRMEGGIGYDNLSYEVPENWNKDGLEELRYWRGKSHYRNFIKKIEEILKDNPNQKFFLCTDREENYQAFLEVFGDRIIYVKRDVFDRSKQQIQYALIDMILLSKTKYILGSSWSSFTETAIRIGVSDKKILLSGRDF